MPATWAMIRGVLPPLLSRRRRRAARVARPARARGAAAAWALAVCVLASPPSQADVGGEPALHFYSAEGAFTARFPETPLYEEKREPTLLGVLRSRIWEVERDALRLAVERHDVPALAPWTLGEDGLLERAARELLADSAARQVEVERVRLRGHPGRHLRYEPGERPGETEDAWLYLLGRRLYVIFARGDAPETRADALRFAASVEILDE